MEADRPWVTEGRGKDGSILNVSSLDENTNLMIVETSRLYQLHLEGK